MEKARIILNQLLKVNKNKDSWLLEDVFGKLWKDKILTALIDIFQEFSTIFKRAY